MSPAVTVVVPLTVFMLVDLPDAFPPSRQTIWAGITRYETSVSARNLP
jgi:hypothetical protein